MLILCYMLDLVIRNCCIMEKKRDPAERVERENISLGLPRAEV